MKKYFVLEIGNSAYTEFLMKDGEYDETCDAILVDEVEANSKDESYEKVINAPENKNKVFDEIILK